MNPQDKRSIPLLVMWMTALTQAAMTLYIPAFPKIAESLQLSPGDVKATLTAFLLGFGLSQLIYGPLSERHGRKPLLLIGIAIFCIFCFVNLFVHSFWGFAIARFFQGVGSGSIITLGRSILRDCFSGKELSSAASYASMGFAIGFGVSPVIGAYLQTYFGWESNFLFNLLLGIGFLILLVKKLPETGQKSDAAMSWKEFIGHTRHSFSGILRDKVFWQFLIAGVFAYSVLVSYNVMTPFLIQKELGFSADAYGWMTLFVSIFYFFAAYFNKSLVMKFHLGKIMMCGTILIALSGIAILIGSSMILTPWIILIPMIVATSGQSLIFSNTISGAMQGYAHIPGKASAIFSSLQMLLAGVISGIMAYLPNHTPIFLGIVVLVMGLLIILPLRATIKNTHH